jgi:hypothetical protein
MKRVSWLVGLSILLLPLAAVYAQTLGNGDVNGDGVVNNADLQAVIHSWDTTSHPGDQYGDGVVNGMDYALVKGRIPTQTPGSQAGEWTQFGHDAQHTNHTSQVVATPWKYRWQWNGADATGKPQASHIAIPRLVQPVTGGTNVYIAATTGVYALSQATGAVAWSNTALGTLNSTPVYDNGFVYVASTNGTLYQLNAGNGSVALTFAANGSLNTAPLLVGNTLYVDSAGGSLYAVNKQSMAKTWEYPAGSPGVTSPAYSPSRNVVIFVSQDLFVHAVNAANGTLKWHVKPTGRNYECVTSGSDPCSVVSTTGAQAQNGWPVIAEQHGIVFIRYRLDWQTLWTFGNYPSTNAAIRADLTAHPDQQPLFALSLDTGAQAFVPAVGNGGEGDGGYLPMGPMPVVDVVGGQEVAYIQWRNGSSCPNSCDGRWDTTMGEMVLDDTMAPEYHPGDLRFVQTQFFPTDETMQSTMAGNTYFINHWLVAASWAITNRATTLGDTFANPIQASPAPYVIWREAQTATCTFNPATRYCTNLYSYGDTRSYGPGFYEYFDSRNDGDSAPYTIVSDGLILVKAGDGGLIALQNGNPTAQEAMTHQFAQANALAEVPTPAVQAGIVPWQDAGQYIGQTVTVDGTIQSDVNHLPKAVYLGFTSPHDGALLVRIFSRDIGKFAYDLTALQGKHVQITGMVTLYPPAGMDPEIIVTDPDQIRIVDS